MSPDLVKIADKIIQTEKGHNSWTLMHRFNMCHDLLDSIDDPNGLALLFVWLRFSALRQLDWQRNYNTKPRELTHAQQRLTFKLASLYQSQSAEGREIIRLIFSTLGRGAEGGKGQRIRDDILHIMHRHHLKEVSGDFLEEWHQKLHNNTTPDDVVICQAYLEFLRSDGNLNTFYQTLEKGGVTRDRLKSFERPIVAEPRFIPHLKEGLIHDFSNYLNLLNSIHSATDLAAAIEEAGRCLEGDLSNKARWLYDNRDNPDISLLDQVRTITELRISLQGILDRTEADDFRREILYLDIALEEFLRMIVERNTQKTQSPDLLEDLIELLTENVGIYHPDPELKNSLDLLGNIKRQKDSSPEDKVLQLIAVNERLSSVLASFADDYTVLLQEKAEYLGRGFEAENWVINLFSQEIIRAGSAFVLSILLNLIDGPLRKKAGQGSWQIISRGEAGGRLLVEELANLQNAELEGSTVLISDKLSGDEEITDNLTGLITASSVDVLSHVAVRARNAGIFFAFCYDRGEIEELKKMAGRPVVIEIDSSGDVILEEKEVDGKPDKKSPSSDKGKLTVKTRESSSLVLGMDDFEPGIVGGKAYQLKKLRDNLPSWINLPVSLAIPFGVCEKVLGLDENKKLREEYTKLTKEVKNNPPGILPEIRNLIRELTIPPDLLEALRKAMDKAGLDFPDDVELTKKRIKQIWASKWNDRAYYSRKKYGISHQELVMSVLIQQTVSAEYAFVLHTVNPFTGEKDELYGEVVVGLGETLCSGNYQGKALSFTCQKSENAAPVLKFYPSKREALFGGGLIFRSDSNGEDLPDYSGAGLYDSFTLESPEEKIIDYNQVDLLWNEKERDNFFRKLTELGIEVEKAMGGTPQDIEGAYAQGKFHVVQTRAQVGTEIEETKTRIKSKNKPQREAKDKKPEKKSFYLGTQTSYSAASFWDPFDYAVENNFDAFEWFPDKKEDGSGWDIEELTSSQLKEIRDIAGQKNILLSVHAPWWANPLHKNDTDLLLKNLEFAAAIKAKVFNLHFYKDQGLDLFLEKLEPVILATHKAGIKLAIENTPETTPEDCNHFFSLLNVKEIPREHVGLCLDLGHANICATTRNDYVGYLKAIDPQVPIIHIHFHENFGDSDSHLPLFTGPSKDNPEGIRLVLESLQKRNFAGAIVFEQWPEPPSLLLEAREKLLALIPPPKKGGEKEAPKKKQ